MFNIIVDLALNIIWYTSRGVYNTGYWLVKGTPKTREEVLLERQMIRITYLEEELYDIRQLIGGKTEDEIMEDKYCIIESPTNKNDS